MQTSTLPRMKRSNSLRERRSTSHGNIRDHNVDSDDCASIASAPAHVPRKTKSSTLRRRFTLHCDHSSKFSAEEVQNYLTPTQRYEKQIRQLRLSLRKVSKQLQDKECELEYLHSVLSEHGIDTLAKKFNEITVINEENILSETESIEVAPVVRNELCDSGVVTDENGDSFAFLESMSIEHDKELSMLKMKHVNEMQDFKQNHNNKVEELLARISEINARHCDLRESYDNVLDRSRELEKQIENMKREAEEKEKHHHQMYVKMYKKGQDAAKFEQADENMMPFVEQGIDKTTIPDLLQQLRLAEHELDRIKRLYQREVYNHRGEYPPSKNSSNGKTNHPPKDPASEENVAYLSNVESEITLGFLRDVVYHYFTERDHSCCEGHLKALISILGYNEVERKCIEKGVKKKRRLV